MLSFPDISIIISFFLRERDLGLNLGFFLFNSHCIFFLGYQQRSQFLGMGGGGGTTPKCTDKNHVHVTY